MTEQDPVRKTHPVSVRGREVSVYKLIDTQMLMLLNGAQLLQHPNIVREKKLKTISQMFKILRSAVPGEEDQEYLDDLMIEGKLDLRELLGFINDNDDNDEEAPSEEVKPKVRRARPPAKRV